jgi:nucleotide-binding universal stress UspA family protein
MSYRSIVVGTDGTDAANETVRQGAALARSVGASLHIVSAYEEEPRWRREQAAGQIPVGLDVDSAGDPQQAARAVAEDAAHEVRRWGVEITLHVRAGDPAKALCDVATRVGAGVILVGNRGVRSPLRKVRAPIFRRIERNAPCDVQVVDTEPFRHPAASVA